MMAWSCVWKTKQSIIKNNDSFQTIGKLKEGIVQKLGLI